MNKPLNNELLISACPLLHQRGALHSMARNLTQCSPYAMKSINELRRRLDAGEDEGKLIKEAGKELGDSVEKILFVNQALNKKEGK